MDSLIDLTTEDHMIDDDVVITGVTPAAAPESTGGPAASHQRQILIAEEVSASKHAEHNLRIYNEMRPGDLLEFYRGLYTHWGVCIGDGQIIHLSGEDDDGISETGKIASISGTAFTVSGVEFGKAKVKCDSFWDVARGSKANINNSKDEHIRPDATHIIVSRALSKIGQIGYNMLWSNCEHFASWCRYGMAWSEQVDKFMRIIDRGKNMISAAAMMVGFTPPRLRPYLTSSTNDHAYNPNNEDANVTMSANSNRFPEIEF